MSALPAIRDIFIPDSGHTILDVDLSGADAQVVAWEANDDDLKAAFRSGLKIHAHNAVSLFPELGPYRVFEEKRKQKDIPTLKVYDEMKRGVHGTNYGSSAKTIAQTLGWSIRKAEEFQHSWLSLHPGIKTWHQRVERSLNTTRRVANAFGFHCIFFDRPHDCFTKALAWVPQSTVGIVTARADASISEYLVQEKLGDVLLQVHDSLIIQIKTPVLKPTLTQVHRLLHSVIVPYSDPLLIPWGLKISQRSWGHCKAANWEDYLE